MQFTMIMEERHRLRAATSDVFIYPVSSQQPKLAEKPRKPVLSQSPLSRFLFTFGIPRSSRRLLRM